MRVWFSDGYREVETEAEVRAEKRARLPKPHIPEIDRDAPPNECELYILQLRRDRAIAALERLEAESVRV